MRNALILLAVVALLILVAGAVNNGVAFDVDYVAGTVKAVSLFSVAAVIAAAVFIVGLVAAWLAQRAMVGSRRKLEAELQSTFERLRKAESLAVRPAPVATVEATVAEATVVADEAATAVEAEDVTAVEAEAPAGGSDEAVTAVAGEVAPVAGAGEETEVAAPPADETTELAAPPADETTAVTLAGEAAGEPQPDAGEAAGEPQSDAGQAARAKDASGDGA